MRENKVTFIRLFLAMFKISAFTFGGGYVIVSLMKKQFVEKKQWLTEREMLDFTAIAQSSPGAIAVNASILVGFRLKGAPGAVVAAVATILPPLVLLTAISYVYTAFIALDVVRWVMTGMQAGVAAVICDVVVGLSVAVWKESRWLAIITAIVSFGLVFFFSVNVIVIVIVCALMGMCVYGRGEKSKC